MTKAAQLAKLKKYHAEEYPLVGSFLEQLLNQAENHNNYLDSHMRMVLGEFYQPFVELRNARNRELLQARIPFTLEESVGHSLADLDPWGYVNVNTRNHKRQKRRLFSNTHIR